jgi:hypothetical protein
MSLSQVLLEGRKDDFLKKYKEKFTPEQLKKVFMLSRSLASNQKYLMFLGKAIGTESFDENLSKGKKAVEEFIRYQKNLEKKDINQYDSFDEIIQAIERHENKVRRKVKEVDGADVVYEDDRYTVITPKNHNASCYYGAGTKWCTASKNGSTHYDNYNVDGKLFYIIDKTAKSSDRFYKVALLQKYDGNKTFFDAPDKVFSNEWILGTPKWDEIQSIIDDYIVDNYSREIEIFKDKERARLERERIRKQQERQRAARKLMDAEDRKENDEWNLDENDDEEAEKANAVFEVIQEYGVIVDEDNDESIYNLIPGDYSHYGLSTFEWLGDDDTGTTWAVGDWDEAYEAAREYQESLFEDMGLEGWNPDFISGYIDEDSIREFLTEMYEYDVNDSWESYFEPSEMELADWQESQIEKLEEEYDNMQEILNDETEDEDDREDAEERMDEITNEIEEIKEDPQGGPTYEMVEDMVENLVDDRMSGNLIDLISELGLDLSEYVNVSEMIGDTIDMDGTGPALGTYDGTENEASINGTWYYVYKID